MLLSSFKIYISTVRKFQRGDKCDVDDQLERLQISIRREFSRLLDWQIYSVVFANLSVSIEVQKEEANKAKIKGTNKDNNSDGTKIADQIYGGGGADRSAGHRGDDAGNDKLGGGQGHDILTSRAGEDTFVFTSFAKADSDRIQDFKPGVDSLDFEGGIFNFGGEQVKASCHPLHS